MQLISIGPLFLSFGVPGHGIPSEFSHIEANLIIHVEEGGVLVVGRWLFVVDSSQRVEGPRHLEHFGHLVLQKLFWLAVGVEAVVAQVPEDLLDLTIVVKHVVNFVQEPPHVHYIINVKIIELLVDIVENSDRVLAKAFAIHFIVVVFVETPGEALESSSPFLHGQVDFPHNLFILYLLWRLG